MKKYDFIGEKINSDRRLVSLYNMWGYVNGAGVEVIPLQYNIAYEFDNGFAVVCDSPRNNEGERLFYIINVNGEKIYFDYCHDLSFVNCNNKALIVNKYGRCAFTIPDFQMILSLSGNSKINYGKYHQIEFDSKTGYVKVNDFHGYGIFDVSKWREIIPCKYDKIEFKDENTIIGVINGVRGLIQLH